MFSRYAQHKLLSYCFHPRTIVRDGERYVVACGKCDGCLLHKSNLWSSRIQQEIETHPYSVFSTFTYNNKFLPTLKRVTDGKTKGCFWFSDHSDNIRFNGRSSVLRQDHILVYDKYDSYKIQNHSSTDLINYASKNDIQLYLKLLRKDLKEKFYDQSRFFRYFIVSEVGPTTLRNHYHALFFCDSREISEYLIGTALYESWKMCDETLFKLHCSYCDEGTARYVANYVNSYNSLPSIYQHRELRPFRLSSKSPAIGFSTYDKKEVQESFVSGDGTYVRTIRRAGENHILCYSQDYLRSVFPKCYRFGELSFARLLYVYGYLYRESKGYQKPYLFLSSRLSKIQHVSDWNAMRKCYDYCLEFGCTPFHYLYVLDMVYYKSAMRALKMQYEYLERKKSDYMACFVLYHNLSDYIANYDFLSDSERLMLDLFFENYGIYDINRFMLDKLSYDDPDLQSYINEVSDIVSGLSKMPKFNELTGNAPHIV